MTLTRFESRTSYMLPALPESPWTQSGIVPKHPRMWTPQPPSMWRDKQTPTSLEKDIQTTCKHIKKKSALHLPSRKCKSKQQWAAALHQKDQNKSMLEKMWWIRTSFTVVGNATGFSLYTTVWRLLKRVGIEGQKDSAVDSMLALHTTDPAQSLASQMLTQMLP